MRTIQTNLFSVYVRFWTLLQVAKPKRKIGKNWQEFCCVQVCELLFDQKNCTQTCVLSHFCWCQQPLCLFSIFSPTPLVRRHSRIQKSPACVLLAMIQWVGGLWTRFFLLPILCFAWSQTPCNFSKKLRRENRRKIQNQMLSLVNTIRKLTKAFWGPRSNSTWVGSGIADSRPGSYSITRLVGGAHFDSTET